MTSFFHPEGAKSVDSHGERLKGLIAPIDLPPQADPFPTQRVIAGELTEKDFLGEPELNQQDYTCRIVTRIFHHAGANYALHEEGCRALRDVADRLLRMSPRLRQVCSKAFLEKEIFHWCRDSWRGDIAEPLSEYIERTVAASVEDQTIWIPLAGLEVQVAFPLGPVRIQPMAAAYFDRHEQHFLSKNPEHSANIANLFASMRRDLQGAAAVVVTIQAEPQHARDTALELADNASALLRIFSLAAVTPWRYCACAPRGSEYIPSAKVIRQTPNSDDFAYQDGIRDDRLFFWRMSSGELASHMQAGMAAVGALVAEDGLSDFAGRLRTCLLTYARGLASVDLNDRLVQTLSALEGLLLKDASEPIQQNLGERMAFLIAKDPEERRKIVRTLKDVYRIRSQYVHHLVSSADEETLDQFVLTAHTTFTAALRNLHIPTHKDFLDGLDRLKFGG